MDEKKEKFKEIQGYLEQMIECREKGWEAEAKVYRNRAWETLFLMKESFVIELYHVRKNHMRNKKVYFESEPDGFFVNLTLELIEKYDPEEGDFENYFNKTWSKRKYNYAQKKQLNYESVIFTSIDAPVSAKRDDNNELTLGDVLITEESEVDNIFLSDLIQKSTLDIAQKICSLYEHGYTKKHGEAEELYFKLLFTETASMVFKQTSWFDENEQYPHEKELFQTMKLEFLDLFMTEICRRGIEINTTQLRRNGEFEIVNRAEEELDFPFPAKVYHEYFWKVEGDSASESSLAARLSQQKKKFDDLRQQIKKNYL